MNIGARLILMLALALTGLLLVGGVGFSAFRSANHEVKAMTENAIPSLQATYDIALTYRDLRALLLSHILERDADLRKGFDEKITESRTLATKVVDGYDALITDETDRANYVALKKDFNAYLAAFDESVNYSARDKPDLAQASLYGKVIPASNALEASLKKLSEFNLKAQYNSAQNIDKAFSQANNLFGIVIGVAILASSIFGYLLYGAVKNPLATMERTVEQIGRTLDFTQRVPIHSTDEVGKTVAAFNRLLDSLQASFREIAGGASGVANQANDMAHAAKKMSGSSFAASESATTMAATVEEVTASINHVADRAHDAEAVSRKSGDVASHGESVIHTTVDEINAISTTVGEASKQIDALARETANISAVVGVIREVADQTNLLALNAAIEAARAGEQGRGFAVVADEVRKLAERTSVSTQEIGKLIGTIQLGATNAVKSMKEVVERVGEGVQKAQQAGEAIQQIRQGSSEVVGMVGDITRSIREQSAASNEISRQVERIAQMSEEASGAASNTADAAVALQSLANKMQTVVGRYKL